jgi:hypothetical protein
MSKRTKLFLLRDASSFIVLSEQLASFGEKVVSGLTSLVSKIKLSFKFEKLN